jgi:adenylyl- and sulfurtransferase ThiI
MVIYIPKAKATEKKQTAPKEPIKGQEKVTAKPFYIKKLKRLRRKAHKLSLAVEDFNESIAQGLGTMPGGKKDLKLAKEMYRQAKRYLRKAKAEMDKLL